MKRLFFPLGLIMAGLCMGWLVGGSMTPVVGTAIPVLFGAVAAVFSALGSLSKPSGQKELAVEASWKALQLNHDRMMLLFGLTLFWFFTGFAGGVVLGAMARTHSWFAPNVELPWSKENQPPDLITACKLLVLSSQLSQAGYSQDAIKSVCALKPVSVTDLSKTIEDLRASLPVKGKPGSAVMEIWSPPAQFIGNSSADLRRLLQEVTTSGSNSPPVTSPP